MAGLDAISGFFQIASLMYQNQQAKDAKFENQNTAALTAANRVDEANRLVGETNAQTQQQKSDRIMEAERELGSVRVAAAEGSGMGARMAGEVGFFEGLDLSRMETNRQERVSALEAQKSAILTEADRGIVHAQSLYDAQRTSAFLGTIGSGLKIASNAYARSTTENAATNRSSSTANGGSFGGGDYYTNGDLALS